MMCRKLIAFLVHVPRFFPPLVWGENLGTWLYSRYLVACYTVKMNRTALSTPWDHNIHHLKFFTKKWEGDEQDAPEYVGPPTVLCKLPVTKPTHHFNDFQEAFGLQGCLPMDSHGLADLQQTTAWYSPYLVKLELLGSRCVCHVLGTWVKGQRTKKNGVQVGVQSGPYGHQPSNPSGAQGVSQNYNDGEPL